MIRKHCGICGGKYALTKDGKLYKHQRHMGAAVKGYQHVPFRVETCPGSGHEPNLNPKGPFVD